MADSIVFSMNRQRNANGALHAGADSGACSAFDMFDHERQIDRQIIITVYDGQVITVCFGAILTHAARTHLIMILLRCPGAAPVHAWARVYHAFESKEIQ